MAVAQVRKLFTVSDYHAMADAGILGEDERVELVEGEICEMTPVGSAHASQVKRLAEIFIARLGRKVTVGIQDPILLSKFSEPQPDLALLRRREDFYATSHPTAADVLLVIEVADSSQDYDRRVKGPLYSEHGIAEYWLFDLGTPAIEAYGRPSPEGYREMRRYLCGDTIFPLAFPDLLLSVDELLA